MNIEEQWRRAIEGTRIIRSRVRPLAYHEATLLPYVFLAESALNRGDTVVRRGRIRVTPPTIVLPQFSPQFDNFPMDERQPIDPDTLVNFLLVRGMAFPSLKYRNDAEAALDIYEGSLQEAIAHYGNRLERMEDVHGGLVVGPEDCWQWSLVLFIGSLAERSAGDDVRRWLEDLRRRLPPRNAS